MKMEMKIWMDADSIWDGEDNEKKRDPLMFICLQMNLTISVTLSSPLTIRSPVFFIENGANEKRDIKFISIHITSMIYKWNHYFLVLVMEMFKTIQKKRGIKTLGVFLNDGRRVGFASINLMGNPQCDAFDDLFQLVNKKKILYIFIFITNRFSPFSCLNSFLAFWHSVGLLPPLLLSTLGIVSGGL